MAISISHFKNIWDNKPSQLDFSDWNQFEKFLCLLSQRKLKGKKDAELISPATYVDNTTRANRNVLGWIGWTAVDVDSAEINNDIKIFVKNIVKDKKFICYSTASSTLENPKFRLVFELSRDVDPDEIRHFWFALQSDLGDLGDKQCKDYSRMYYTPGYYTNAYNFYFTSGSNHGHSIDVDELLVKYPYVQKKASNNFFDRLPEEIQKQVIDHRKSKMEATGFTWSSYHDCPFVNKKLIQEYKSIAYTDNTGRYAMIYKIMVSIALTAIKREYPISTNEIVTLIRQLDMDTANRYVERPLDVEADRALEYAYRNV